MNSDVETWLPIPGYEGFYEVSDMGRVRGITRVMECKNGTTKTIYGRVLSPFPQKSGHLNIVLCRGAADQQKYRVHRLVMLAFEGPAPTDMLVCHWNDLPADNRLANLRYATASENKLDSVRNGIHPESRKTHCIWGHEFTPENTGTISTRPGSRQCKTCARQRARESILRRKGALL